MSIADDVVLDFGRTLGMPGLAFNQNGVVRLRFEKAGVLSVGKTPRGALLQLVRPLDRFKDGVMERALDLCHPEKVDRLRPDAGMTKDGELVFSVRIDEKAIDLASITNAFDLLSRLHDRAAG